MILVTSKDLMTSNDLKATPNESIKNKKNKLKGGAMPVQENIEINEHYLDKILKNNNT